MMRTTLYRAYVLMVSSNHHYIDSCLLTISYCINCFCPWWVHDSKKACKYQIFFKGFSMMLIHGIGSMYFRISFFNFLIV